jgi:ABC-2 type transport system permease protein
MTALVRAAHDGWIVTLRNLTKIKRVPDLIVFSTIQPIMFILLFVYVFGGAIPIPGISYTEYLMGGIFCQTVAFGTTVTAVGLAEDVQKGIIDRFRSLPMERSAVLVGRTSADLLNNALVLVVMLITGFLVGWRVRSSFVEAVAACLLLLLFGYALSWISALIGLSVRTVEVANNAGFLWVFPLTFISSVFVATETMPSWLQPFAEWNPITTVSNSVRILFGNFPEELRGTGFPNEHPLELSMFYIVVLLAVFMPLSVRKYRKVAAR